MRTITKNGTSARLLGLRSSASGTSRNSCSAARCCPRSKPTGPAGKGRSEEHTSELQSRLHLVCRLLLEKKKQIRIGSVNAFAIFRHTSGSFVYNLRVH